MRRFSLILSSILILIFNYPVFAQSGRGRPVTPTREPAPAAPPPVMVPEATSIVKREQAGNLSRFALKNGITVLIHERHAYPMVSVVAYFKIPETDANKGAAIILPKMMMRGTPFRSGEQIANEMRALGSLINAESRPGGIIFSFLAPPDKLKDALAIQADIIQHPAFADEEIKRETALPQAFLMANSHFNSGKSSEAFFNLDTDYLIEHDDAANYSLLHLLDAVVSYPSAPSNTQVLTRDQLMQFYQTNLRPENLVFSVVGDITPFNALIEIQRLYGAFTQNPTPQESQSPAVNKPGKVTNTPVRPQPNASKPTAKTPVPTARTVDVQPTPAKTTPPATPASTDAPQPEKPLLRYANERSDLSQTIISVGFRLPKLDVKERASLTVLANLLAEGRGSRLRRSLFIGQGVLSRVDAQLLTFADSGLLAVQMWLDATMIDRAEAAFFREINRLRREIPTEAEINRARMLAEKQFIDENSDDFRRALWLAVSNDSQITLRALNEARLRLQEVSAEDVQRTAAKYLTLSNTSIHEYEPLNAAPRNFTASQFETTVSNWAAGFGDAIDSKQVRAAEESFALLQSQTTSKSEQELSNQESIEPLPVKNFSTLNGPQAYVREDRTQPRVTIAILFQGGRIVEDENNQGITELMLRTMLYGTTKRPQATEELEQLGAEVKVISEPDFYGLGLSTLSRNANQAFKIVRDLLEDPAFRDEDIVKARNEQMSLIRSRRDALFSRANELLMQGLFINHPYGYPPHGREITLGKFNAEAVKEWHAHTIKRMLPLIVIVGDTDGSALISGDVVNTFRRKDIDTSLRARVPQAVKPIEKVEPRKIATSVVDVGFADAKGGAEDEAALDVLEAAMNGNTGRLMMELRDKQNLAYDGFVTHHGWLIAGAISAQLLTASENEQRASTALVTELDRLAKSGLSANEFKNARAVATTASLIHWRSPENRALAYAAAAFFQRQVTDVDAAVERLSKVTAEDVKRAAAAYFKSSSAAVGIVRGATAQK